MLTLLDTGPEKKSKDKPPANDDADAGNRWDFNGLDRDSRGDQETQAS